MLENKLLRASIQITFIVRFPHNGGKCFIINALSMLCLAFFFLTFYFLLKTEYALLYFQTFFDYYVINPKNKAELLKIRDKSHFKKKKCK